jgi:hypothetical protein
MKLLTDTWARMWAVHFMYISNLRLESWILNWYT